MRKIVTIEEINDYLKNEKPNFICLSKSYINNQTPLLFDKKDCKHKPFLATWANMRKKNYGGCPICAQLSRNKTLSEKYRKIYHKEDIYTEVNNLFDGEFYLKEGQTYISNKKDMIFICKKKNHEFSQSLVNFRRGFGCPICNRENHESIGSKEVRKVLNKYHIKYETEKQMPNMKYKRNLKFDFYFKTKNNREIVIEYDGQYHTRIRGSRTTDKELNEQKVRDNIKNNYCMENNILLLRISYKIRIIDIEPYILNFFKDNHISNKYIKQQQANRLSKFNKK